MATRTTPGGTAPNPGRCCYVGAVLKSGDSFERYLVDEVLGQGGMGCVCRARDPRLDRHVALKVISDETASPEAKARLVREARAAAALDHPNAVAIFDVGEVAGTPYIVMEQVSGKTLRAAVGTTTIPIETRVAWLADVAKVLSAAHKRKLVHRDIKPENVMVRDDGVVKVLDFGIARRAGTGVDPVGPTASAPALATLTRDGVRLGTPLYMAPEQIKGADLDGRADQFAWGVVAYELLAGQLPWRGADALGAVASILTDEPSPIPLEEAGVPAPVRAAVMRALAKRRDERFASMDELLAAIAEAPIVPDQRARGAPTSTESAPEPAPGTTDGQRYSTQQVRDILERAVERQAQEPDTRLRFDELLAAAREVGVDEETLREASRDVRGRGEPRPEAPPPAVAAPTDDDAAYQAWRRRQRRGLWRHFAAFVIISGAFLLLGLLVGKLQLAAWTVFWAMGLGVHAVHVLSASRDDWEDRKGKLTRRERRRREREAFREEREARRRRRQEAVDRAIDEGASLVLAAGEKIRSRLEQAAARAAARAGAAGTTARRSAPPSPHGRFEEEPQRSRIAQPADPAESPAEPTESADDGSVRSPRVER